MAQKQQAQRVLGGFALPTGGDLGGFVPVPVSRISLSPFETNYYLVRGQSYALGKPAAAPLSGFINGGAGPPTCGSHDCTAAPTAFCSTQVCPPLTAPFSGGCLTSVLTESGRRETVVVPAER